MKAVKLLALFGMITLLVCTMCPVKALAQEGSQGKHEGSAMKEEGAMPQKHGMCNEAHMNMMMQTREDRVCVVEAVLADKDTREILITKIAEDPEMRKKVMKKCSMMEKMDPEGSMMKHKEMMQPEGSMMKQEETMREKGNMMKRQIMMPEEGSMMKQEGGGPKK